jgi:saccharopine dehydrogenase-like NADP-dependent oxidoreductase
MNPKIVVAGASGHTGKFVVDLLRQRGAIPIPATRSGGFVGLDGSERPCNVIDFADLTSLDGVLRDADAVINCAGPFFDTAVPCAEAAIRAGIPYLDVTAEQKTVQTLFEQLHTKARDAGLTIVPAMAFYGGLADLLVSAVALDEPKIDSIEIAVGLDFWHPTPGTRLTGERNTFQRLVVRDGQLVPIPSPPPTKSWNFPGMLGQQPVTCVTLAEIILIARHIHSNSVTSFMNLAPLADIGKPDTPAPQAIDASGRSAQQFVVDVRVVAGGRDLRATATGRDIYAATAPLVVNACLGLLGPVNIKRGVCAPGELFEPRAFLAALAPEIDVRF